MSFLNLLECVFIQTYHSGLFKTFIFLLNSSSSSRLNIKQTKFWIVGYKVGHLVLGNKRRLFERSVSAAISMPDSGENPLEEKWWTIRCCSPLFHQQNYRLYIIFSACSFVSVCVPAFNSIGALSVMSNMPVAIFISSNSASKRDHVPFTNSNETIDISSFQQILLLFNRDLYLQMLSPLSPKLTSETIDCKCAVCSRNL